MRKLLLVIGLVICISLLAGSAAAYATAPYQPITYYVNGDATGANNGANWTDAFTDLQSALNAAVTGDEIWVAAGTYKPSLSIDGSADARTVAFILKSGVKIYGGFAGDENQVHKRRLDPSLTVLSGDIGTAGVDTDNSYHVVYANGVTGALLDGFTVTGGCGDVPGRDSRGAGMYNYDSSLIVSNCIFSANRVTGTARYTIVKGAGMYNENSAPTVTDCTFSDNQAGDVSYSVYGQGGGMYNSGTYGSYPDESGPRVIGCTFARNAVGSSYFGIEPNGGGGMYNGACYMGGMPTITNCIFDANFTTGYGFGGAIYNLASPTILNCTFYRNGWRLMPVGYPEPRLRPWTYSGGAIYQCFAGCHITNCIFSDNAVSGSGGAITYYTVRGGSLTNCLFSENISWSPNSGSYSDHICGIPPGFTESGNLYDINPLFVSPAGGDFHLQKDSPCIDAGDYHHFGTLYWAGYNTNVAVPATDFYGATRVIDGDGDTTKVLDIGAAEYVPNLPDLRAFLEGLADVGEIDAGLAARLLAYVDAAQAAVAEDDEATAIRILNELIADVQASLGDTETAQAIQRKTEAVIERL